MPNRLLQLLADNRGAKARRFAVVVNENAAADEAEVFLYDAVVGSEAEAEWWGGVAPESFVKALRAITAGTIHLRINSPGGSVFAARAMETALREHRARIVVHIDGWAASAASFIAMAGDEIVMSKGAMMMIHKGWTYMIGNADDMHAEAALLDKVDGTLVQTYVDRSGQSSEQVLEWMKAETWFTAQEAVEYGLADRIAEAGATADADAQAHLADWNLAAYLKAPAAARQDRAKPTNARERADPAADPQSATATPEHRDRQRQRMSASNRLAIV